MKEKTLGHIYALFTILVWGSCFVLTKVMLTAYTPTQIIPLRMGLAYLTLWALRPKTMKLPWKDELMFILIGITGGSFYFFLQNTASAHTSAANVSILVSMSPILTVILAQLFSRKGEKLGKLVYIGAVVAIAGVVLVVLNGTLSFHLSPLGDLLALAAALMWAVYSILVKRYTERYDNFLVTRRVFLWAFLTSLPLVLLTDGLPSLTPLFTQPNILISWLFLGVFGNAVCFAIWNIAFKRLGVVVTNNYLYASPFVTVVVGWLLLDEKISWMSILGAVRDHPGRHFRQQEHGAITPWRSERARPMTSPPFWRSSGPPRRTWPPTATPPSGAATIRGFPSCCRTLPGATAMCSRRTEPLWGPFPSSSATSPPIRCC